MGRIILQQIGQIVGGNNITHRHDIERRAQEILLNERAKYEAADAAKAIDCYFNCHVGDELETFALADRNIGRGRYEKEAD